jgi:F-type H+-transporting ATPase subunit epsilon
MYLEIITPEKVLFKEEVDELIVPTVNGEIAILPHHVNLLTEIVPGEMTIKIKNKEQHLAITGGFLQMLNNTLTLLADYAVRSEEIDAKKALEAQKRAEEILKKKSEGISQRDFEQAQSEFRRAIAELKVANRRKRSQFPSGNAS